MREGKHRQKEEDRMEEGGKENIYRNRRTGWRKEGRRGRGDWGSRKWRLEGEPEGLRRRRIKETIPVPVHFAGLIYRYRYRLLEFF